MKKFLPIIAAIVLASSVLTACDDKDSKDNKKETKEKSPVAETEKEYEDITFQGLVIPKEAKAEETYFSTNYYEFLINNEYEISAAVHESGDYNHIWGSDEQKYYAAEDYLLGLGNKEIDDNFTAVSDHTSSFYDKLSIEESYGDNSFMIYRFEYDGDDESVAYYATNEFDGYRYVFSISSEVGYSEERGAYTQNAEDYHDDFINLIESITHV